MFFSLCVFVCHICLSKTHNNKFFNLKTCLLALGKHMRRVSGFLRLVFRVQESVVLRLCSSFFCFGGARVLLGIGVPHDSSLLDNLNLLSPNSRSRSRKVLHLDPTPRSPTSQFKTPSMVPFSARKPKS